MQAPEQSSEQQTPSRQRPEAHCTSLVQLTPSTAGTTTSGRPRLGTPWFTAKSRPAPGANGAGGIHSAWLALQGARSPGWEAPSSGIQSAAGNPAGAGYGPPVASPRGDTRLPVTWIAVPGVAISADSANVGRAAAMDAGNTLPTRYADVTEPVNE